MSFIIVGYYTKDTFYEEEAAKFKASLVKFKIPYYIERIENLGDWNKNTSYKPTFLKKMLAKFPEHNIVYVDCDAEFLAYPYLFDGLDCNVGVYLFDKSQHKKKGCKGFEVLSGTIFLKNNQEVLTLVEEWERRCIRNPYTWDQKSLEKVLAGKFYTIPGEYCKIFDLMDHIENPVIVHYQASRRVRKNKGLLK